MKYIFLIIFIVFLNCNIKNKEDFHGISNLRLKINEIKINETNQNDIIKLFGVPILKDSYDKNIWSYYEIKKKTNIFGNKKIILHDVVILKFNNLGLITNYETYDINSLNNLVISEEYTQSKALDESALKSILSTTKKRWDMARERLRSSKSDR